MTGEVIAKSIVIIIASAELRATVHLQVYFITESLRISCERWHIVWRTKFPEYLPCQIAVSQQPTADQGCPLSISPCAFRNRARSIQVRATSYPLR